MKIEQIAFTGPSIKDLKYTFSLLGVDEWVQDTVTAKGKVFGDDATNVAELHFNYQMGFELELLEYKEGNNWLAHRDTDGPQLSHMGLHVTRSQMENIKRDMYKAKIYIAQEVITQNHTNPGVQGRTYHYVVFDSRKRLGFDLKLIERIAPNNLCETKKCTLDFDVGSVTCIDCMEEARAK